MGFFRARIRKMLTVRIANREDPAIRLLLNDLGLNCFSGPFWQATSVRNFRTFTISCICILLSIK